MATSLKIYLHHPTVPKGKVISQTPPYPTLALEDQVITIYLSLGPGGWFADSANSLAASRRHYYIFLAVDFDFPSGHVRLWSGYGTLSFAGNDYVGAHHLTRVSSHAERSNLAIERKTYQLAGASVDPAVVPEDDIDGSFGRSVTEYLGFLDPDSRQLVGVPEVNFEGEISNIRRRDGREPAIEVNAEHRLALLDQVDGWRYTHEHQAQFYADDNGLNMMQRNEMREILWGGHRVSPGGGVGGGGRGGARPRLP